MVLPNKSSTTSSASIKSVQDGCQESLPQSTSANVLRSANTYSTATTMKAKKFLSRIVTGDEMWVHHYEPESKRQSMEWKHLGSPVKKKFKTQPSTGKVMLTVFWDSEGPILEDYLEKGHTINSA